MTPMSSVPVQFLIYVQSQPACSIDPIIFPLDRCLEVQVGVSISFNLSAMNLCNASVATLTDISVSSGITGMNRGNLTRLSTNSSIYYVRFTWTPQTNQIGLQQLCTIASTSPCDTTGRKPGQNTGLPRLTAKNDPVFVTWKTMIRKKFWYSNGNS
ncbi:unnamed protein product [Rotaria sp. Silwood1]|nr:unnamed protein product [Rotaria sp. Silwood1]